MDLNLLFYYIKKNNDTVKSLAEDLKVHYNTALNKLNGKIEFNQSEISFIAKRYSLTPEEINRIFF